MYCACHEMGQISYFALKIRWVGGKIKGHSFTSEEASLVFGCIFNVCCLCYDTDTKRLSCVTFCFDEMDLTVCGLSELEIWSKIYPLPPLHTCLE